MLIDFGLSRQLPAFRVMEELVDRKALSPTHNPPVAGSEIGYTNAGGLCLSRTESRFACVI